MLQLWERYVCTDREKAETLALQLHSPNGAANIDDLYSEPARRSGS